MKFLFRAAAVAVLCSAMGACATAPENVQASYVSDVPYQGWTCSQLQDEQDHVTVALASASRKQRVTRSQDAVGCADSGLADFIAGGWQPRARDRPLQRRTSSGQKGDGRQSLPGRVSTREAVRRASSAGSSLFFVESKDGRPAGPAHRSHSRLEPAGPGNSRPQAGFAGRQRRALTCLGRQADSQPWDEWRGDADGAR